MRFEQLRYFQVLAKTGTITAASQQFYISQQALSTAIKKLEDELHTQLFIRTPRGVQLTSDGEYLLNESGKILDILEQLHLHFLAQNHSNIVLNIGAIPVLTRHILPKSISYFYKNLPNVKLNIQTMSPDKILQSLCNGEIDLGFLSEVSQDDSLSIACSDLKFSPLFHLPFFIIMHKNHPLHSHRTLSFEQLTPYPALLLDFGDLENYLPYRILKHYNIDNIIIVDNETLFSQMLEDGLGYSLYAQINQNTIHHTDSTTALHPLKENLFSTIGYIHRDETTQKTPYIKLFCDHL